MRIVTEAGVTLSTPAKAAISREHKVQTNPAEKKRNVRGTADSNVNAWYTLNQWKGEHLTVASGKLRCDACKETESEKKSSVMKHIASQKRIKSKTVITKSKRKDQLIVDLMKRNDERMNVFFFFFFATFVTKKKLLTFLGQLFEKLRETFQEISSNL